VGCENAGCLQPGSEEAEATQSGEESPAAGQPVAYHMVNRRYSEFLNLQTRLEEKHELRKLIKGRVTLYCLASRFYCVMLHNMNNMNSKG